MKSLAILLLLITASTSYAPPIRSVVIVDNQFILKDYTGTKTFTASIIPAQNTTIAAIETWVNGTWIPANITTCQVQVHIFSLNPLRVTVGTWNLGAAIPANWWQ